MYKVYVQSTKPPSQGSCLFLKDSFLDIGFLVGSFYSSSTRMCYPTAFWPLSILLGFLVKWQFVVLLLLLIFSIDLLTFIIFTKMCLVCRSLIVYLDWSSLRLQTTLMFFNKFGNFSAIISSNFSPHSFLSWYSHYVYVGTLNGVLHCCEILFMTHFFPLFFKLNNQYQCIFKLANSFFCQFK